MQSQWGGAVASVLGSEPKGLWIEITPLCMAGKRHRMGSPGQRRRRFDVFKKRNSPSSSISIHVGGGGSEIELLIGVGLTSVVLIVQSLQRATREIAE